MNDEAPAPDMLDDPGISRQWVLRRLQKVLTADLALTALLRGLERSAPERHRADLHLLRERIGARAALARRLIEAEGGSPYSSVGVARAASRTGGWLAGLFGAWTWRPLLRRALEQSYADLDGLVALARDAPGVSEGVAEAMAPEVERCRELLELLEAR